MADYILVLTYLVLCDLLKIIISKCILFNRWRRQNAFLWEPLKTVFLFFSPNTDLSNYFCVTQKWRLSITLSTRGQKVKSPLSWTCPSGVIYKQRTTPPTTQSLKIPSFHAVALFFPASPLIFPKSQEVEFKQNPAEPQRLFLNRKNLLAPYAFT